jgi:hypothetical protein
MCTCRTAHRGTVSKICARVAISSMLAPEKPHSQHAANAALRTRSRIDRPERLEEPGSRVAPNLASFTVKIPLALVRKRTVSWAAGTASYRYRSGISSVSRASRKDWSQCPSFSSKQSCNRYPLRCTVAWNLFGMADLVNAVVLGTLTGAAGIVFPIVLIPIYAVPRAFLIHSYSLIGLIRKTSSQPKSGELLHYGLVASRTSSQ